MRRQPQITQPLARPTPPPVASRVGEYAIIAPLGRGATAQVYLGHHLATGERVAIKMLDPSYHQRGPVAERLLGEADIANRAHHPGLLEIHEATYTPTGIPYVVMEYLDGESLLELIDRAEISLDAIVMICSQIAAAIAALHDGGVIHCDLKPANVYVLYEAGRDGCPRIKVVDYGVARLADDAPLTNGEIAGTPAFMAPEQWHGQPSVKSDVYALGCMMYELVTNEPLFSGTLPLLMMKHCEELPDRPSALRPELPSALERLIVRALAKDPDLRPTMAEMELELSRLGVYAQPAILDATG